VKRRDGQHSVSAVSKEPAQRPAPFFAKGRCLTLCCVGELKSKLEGQFTAWLVVQRTVRLKQDHLAESITRSQWAQPERIHRGVLLNGAGMVSAKVAKGELRAGGAKEFAGESGRGPVASISRLRNWLFLTGGFLQRTNRHLYP
jgi:hypothetical protein